MKEFKATTPAEMIRHLRMTLCMTQREFGEAVGIPGLSICMYECGKRQPRIPNLKKIIEFMATKGIVLTTYDFAINNHK